MSGYPLSDVASRTRHPRGFWHRVSRLGPKSAQSLSARIPLRFVISLCFFNFLFLPAYVPPRPLPQERAASMRPPALGEISLHVKTYLEKAEWQAAQNNPGRYDDLRVSWLTLMYANRQFPDSLYPWENPWERAFHHYYHAPWQVAVARWAERDRETETMLERIAAEHLELPSPKKPVQSVRDPGWRKKSA